MQQEKKYPIGGYAPGNYNCHCGTCGGGFRGDKRAYQCEPCALNDRAKFDALSPAEQEALIKRNAEAMNEMLSKVGTFTTERTAELPIVDNARYELSLALHRVLKVFKNDQIFKEQEKCYSQAEAILKKYSKITDVLRTEVDESPSKEGNKDREALANDAVEFAGWILENNIEATFNDKGKLWVDYRLPRGENKFISEQLYEQFKNRNNG